MGVLYFACNNIYVAFVLCAKVASTWTTGLKVSQEKRGL